MASYSIFIKPSAAMELEAAKQPRHPREEITGKGGAVPRKDRLRIIEKIRGLASDLRPPGCEKLSGEEKYRIRQGSYRILYSIQDDALIVSVIKVGHRRDVYR